MIDQRLQDLADKIVQMRQFSKETGIQTNRSQGALIQNLDPVEVSIVATEVNRQLFNPKQKTEGAHDRLAK